LQAYADAKRLPLEFLRGLGLREVRLRDGVAVAIPYYDETGVEVSRRYREALEGPGRFRWRRGSRVVPYGLWRLKEAREAGWVLLVEGESDAQTLWFHGVPALGLPGATTWQPEWARYVAGLRVFVWHEPGQGGDTMVRRVGETLPEALVIRPPEGMKDISEAHLRGENIPELVLRLIADARPVRDLLAEQLNTEARAAREKATDLLGCPDLLAELERLLPRLGVVGEDRNAKLLYLALTSRLLDRPVSVVVKGPSAAGKSYLVSQVLRLFPDTAYLDLTGMSEHALVYDERPLSHRHVVIYEADGLGPDAPGEANFLAYCLRSLLSEGQLRYITVERTAEGLRPRVVEKPGPTGLITTTTRAQLHPENETRLLTLTVKDTPEQTARVLQAQAARVSGAGGPEPDLGPWVALQRWLEVAGERRVVVPFAPALAELANPKAVRLRRDFEQVLRLIQAHALLHQHHRPRDAEGRVVATLEDYRAVYDLVADLVNDQVEAAVSPAVREVVEAVNELHQANGRPVTLAELAQRLGVDKATASRRAQVALARGYLVNDENRRGRPAQLRPGQPLPEDVPALPHPSGLCASTPPKTTQCCNSGLEPASDAAFGVAGVSATPVQHPCNAQEPQDPGPSCWVCGGTPVVEGEGMCRACLDGLDPDPEDPSSPDPGDPPRTGADSGELPWPLDLALGIPAREPADRLRLADVAEELFDPPREAPEAHPWSPVDVDGAREAYLNHVKTCPVCTTAGPWCAKGQQLRWAHLTAWCEKYAQNAIANASGGERHEQPSVRTTP